MLAEDIGFEPMITASKAVALDQAKLIPNKFCLAYPEGFEPSPTVLETAMLPLTPRILNFGLGHRLRTCTFLAPNQVDFLLSQSEKNMVDRNGIEPFLQACKARVPPTTPTAHVF